MNRPNHSIIVGLLVSIIVSCTSKDSEKSNVSIIQTEDGIYSIAWPTLLNEKQSEIALSNIADSISYIRLKTPAGIAVGNIYSSVTTLSKLVIADETSSVFIFSNTGEYISHFNHLGRGPGEYISISDIAYNERNQQIAIANDGGKKIMLYDQQGNCINEIILNSNPERVSFLTDSLLLVKLSPYSKEKEILSSIVVNTEGKTVNQHRYNVIEKSGSNIYIRSYGDLVSLDQGQQVYEPFNDTVYRINKSGFRSSYFINNLGKFKGSREAYEGLNFDENFGSKYFSQIYTRAVNNHVFGYFRYNNYNYYGIADLNNYELLLVDKSKRRTGFDDNIDFGPPFTYLREISDECIIDIIDPIKLNKYKSFDPKSNSGLSILKYDILNQNNPIIRLVWIKDKWTLKK